MEIISSARFQRIAPRKVKLLATALKNQKAQTALEKLEFVPKSSAAVVSKVLKSAIANAVNNFKLDKNFLKIKSIEIGQGPTLKRGRPIARGSFHPIKKKTSHVKITLEG